MFEPQVRAHPSGAASKRARSLLCLAAVLSCLGGNACGDDEEKVLDRVERFCVVGEDREGGVAYDDSTPLEITVQFANCRNDCYEVTEAGCEATRHGLRVAISAAAHLRKYRRNCDPICNIVHTECEIDPLDAGEYVFFASEPVADRALELVVPVPSVAPSEYCVGF